MAEPARSHVGARPSAVVRPLSRAAHRRCSRPGCPTPATATLAFAYDHQHATLVPLVADGGPETYDLCGDHADRTHPPHGWTIEDQRPEEPGEGTPDADVLASERTVAVLAAALHGTPAPQPADEGPAPTAVDTAALDAIAEAPFDEPDLYATVDEADPDASADALDELSALSQQVEPPTPARTVPGAHRPA